MEAEDTMMRQEAAAAYTDAKAWFDDEDLIKKNYEAEIEKWSKLKNAEEDAERWSEYNNSLKENQALLEEHMPIWTEAEREFTAQENAKEA